jgi:hypothetical protein
VMGNELLVQHPAILFKSVIQITLES